MEKVINNLKQRKKEPKKLAKNSKILKTILAAIADKKGEYVVSMDLRKIDEAVADFFILCEAGSSIQINAIANHITEEVKEHCDERPYHTETGSQWTLVDFVNVVVHIFDKENRKFYDLESLWADAEVLEH